MLFVSNSHVLINFRGGKSVILLSNGSIIHQEKRVQELLEKSERVIAESQLYLGKKTVLLEDEYGEHNENMRHIGLQFNKHGYAQLVGIFEDYRKQIEKIFDKRNDFFEEEAKHSAEEINLLGRKPTIV